MSCPLPSFLCDWAEAKSPLFYLLCLPLRSVGVCVSDDSLPSTVSTSCLLVSLLLGTCAMLVKETGITVFGVCMLYDALVLCRKPLI